MGAFLPNNRTASNPMIALRLGLFLVLSLVLSSAAHAQGTQCRTDPVGSKSSNCASETFVTNSIAAIPQPPGGTVTEQKNTFGYGLTPSGNCDNTSTNAASPCNAVVTLSSITNSLGGNVVLNAASFFDGPTVAQGTTGTWLATGTVSLSDTATANAAFGCQLWDGTTVIASGAMQVPVAGNLSSLSLSGVLSSPAANIKISCRDFTSTNGLINSAAGGIAKASTLTVVRLQ